ncbi:SIR2 family protein, partial [Pseudomonas viridiflava]|uniref:SIR2 family protein n=1 Tax=Pseudomonas viridiflava TaxID=33069 RepID=UPI0013DF66E6
CPNLISLGISPKTPASEAAVIFEKIITCANFCSYRSKNQNEEEKNIYIRAYIELVEYLRHLFTAYDEIFTNSPWKTNVKNWNWLEFLRTSYDKFNKINIITLNYDIYLERILTSENIDFQISEIDKDLDKKITIFKPHGSISFVSTVDPMSVGTVPDYQISYKFKDPLSPGEMTTSYSDLSKKRLINTIIPPYGDSARYKQSWSNLILNKAISSAKKSEAIIISGISYWHVDRSEVDRILLSVDEECNIIKINPSSNPIFDAVLQSRFPKYQQYKSSDILKVLNK